ncbi:MAG: IS1634 family transposase [Bacteroidetes bacterium]|nr:MAG: IS1634 family transposase [Bacteroidota bacterium]
MYIRRITRKNKKGPPVSYIQLAHNYRDPDTGKPRAKVLYNFGREEHLDVDALKRLVASISRFLTPEDALAAQGAIGGDNAALRFIESRPMGTAFLLWALWRKLGIDMALARLAQQRGFRTNPAAAIFAMAANRALAPSSKHAIPDWLAHDVWLPGVQPLTDDQLYRAMDFLIEAEAEIQREVFHATADLLNLQVDLLLYDTTSSYFEMDGDDRDLLDRQAAWDAFDRGEGPEPLSPRPQVVNDPPLRRPGHSKDHRPDRAQVVIGMAVTREGIPVRCWVWPGNTHDATTIRTVKEDLRGWRLNRVVWAVDRGFMSDANLEELQRGGAHYIAGEKMRAGKKGVEEALSRAGRFKVVAENLEVKEVVVGEGERRKRYVVVRNPAQLARDRAERQRLLKRLEEELAALPEDKQAHSKAVCRLVSHPTLGRYLRLDAKGRPVIHRAKVRAEERLDGKYLLLTSDDTLSTEDVALGYKQLLEIERAWRCMKSELDIRPMYHRLDQRIRAHVLLCWLALLLVRVVEVQTETTWAQVRRRLDRVHRGVFRTAAGRVVQRTELRPEHRALFRACGVEPPPKFEAIDAV